MSRDQLPRLPSTPWAVVFGGTTPQGKRRASLSMRNLASDMDLVLFDGWTGSETSPTEVTDVHHNRTLIRIDYGARLENSLAGRLGSPPRNGRVRSWLWRRLGRRLGTALRPMAAWLLIKADLRRLEAAGSPSAIVCCDESAITSAWKAAKTWPDSRIMTGPT